jgi:subtilisin family serine protease
VQATLIRSLRGSSEILLVKLPSDMPVMDAVEEYMKDPNVEFAEPNYIKTISAIPSEYSILWGIHNTGQAVNNVWGLTDADMDVLAFWNNSGITGDSSIVIAVIDTGVNLTHQDLDGNLWTNTGETPSNDIDDDGNDLTDDINGWDFVNNDNDPDDDNGHGSHVAGTIASEGDNALGITGVMQDAQIMVLKALDAAGSGTTADIVEAINYAREKNAKIINMSLGGPGSNSEKEALSLAQQAGILVVAAAGNDGLNNDDASTSNKYPASYNLDNIISVAATDQNDNLASFSNYGPTSVDVAAPGVNIYSALHSSDTAYDYKQGTSMATPHVAGVSGLLWALNPGWTYTQVRAALLNSSNTDYRLCLANKIVANGRLNIEQIRTGTADLEMPTGMSATAVSTDQIDLAWTDITGETGYNIYRKTCSESCDAYNLIYTVAADTTAKSDTGLLAGTCYKYIIRAFTATERSDDPAEISATTTEAPVTTSQSDSGHARNCFIATAAYGSALHPYVEELRDFRDQYLLTNAFGRKFVDFYYKNSPPVAGLIKKSDFLRAVTKGILTPLVLFIAFPNTSLMVILIVLVSLLVGIRTVKKQRMRA